MSIAGARPNFMKLASIARAAEIHNQETVNNNPDISSLIEHVIVHTGQHYDERCQRHSLMNWEYPNRTSTWR